MGKIIYEPKGKAGEYAKYAANFYNGCSGRCEYCYNRKGITANVLGGDKPELKKSLVHPSKSMKIFEKEIELNLPELRKHGLFFNFVSDPCLPETYTLNRNAINYCIFMDVPVKLLTKQTWWVRDFISEATSAGTFLNDNIWKVKGLIAFGFTLTGYDELEPGCATNAERIDAMKVLHDEGFKTWASIEPIIDFDSSYRMVEQIIGFCDLYKVGMRSGAKYSVNDAQWFAIKVLLSCSCNSSKVYLKDSLIKLTKLNRGSLKALYESYVDRDYNMFAE